MKYIIEMPKNKKIEDEDLIEDLKRVYEIIGKTPTMNEYNSYGKYEASSFIRRFGSWNKSLKLIGVEVNNKQWTLEELFLNLQNAWEKLGRQPARRHMDDKTLSFISSGSYLRFFGTWMNALDEFTKYVNSEDEGTFQSIITDNENSHKTSRDINLRLRYKVLLRDNFKCCACGASPATDSSVELHIDHIVPYSKGGETVIDNLQTLCKDCNLGKGNLL
jgi:hypothetical protein